MLLEKIKSMKKRLFLCLGLYFLLFSCAKIEKNNQLKNDVVKEIQHAYNEPYRPQFHFSPPEKWMNDPNGLVYNDGVYHLFYQHYPDDIVWGPMHWGHAVSKDLITWEHKPIALFPDANGLIFSGSAVVDKMNTSGFGTKENPPLVAIFTYHLMEGEKAGRTDFQTQGIAYSLDNGDTWTKYNGNPVIGNEGIKDFRDPKVFWHAKTQQWIMVLVAGDHAKFYSSLDLKVWRHMSDFGKEQGAHGGVWECPDLFQLKVDGSDEEKWVLIISINPGAPNGGSGTQYFIGDFDGKTFSAEHDDIRWIDYGTDNYAGVTFNNTPDGDRVFIGWMSNWNYARNTPTEVWRSAMTLPRSLFLRKESKGYFIRSKVYHSISNYILKSQAPINHDFNEQPAFTIENEELKTSRISFSASASASLTLVFTNDSGDILKFDFDAKNKKTHLDRTKSGLVDFEPRFGEKPHEMPLSQMEGNIDFEVFLDLSSIEIFIDKGRYVLTDQVFPKNPFNKISLKAKPGQKIQKFLLEPIKSIWNEK